MAKFKTYASMMEVKKSDVVEELSSEMTNKLFKQME